MGRESLRCAGVCYDGLRVFGCAWKRNCVCENFQPAHICCLSHLEWKNINSFLNNPSIYLCSCITPLDNELQQQPENSWINNTILKTPPHFFKDFPQVAFTCDSTIANLISHARVCVGKLYWIHATLAWKVCFRTLVLNLSPTAFKLFSGKF